MNPEQRLLAESIATKQRPGLVIIMAPTVEERGKSTQLGMAMDVIGGMPLDAALGQLEIVKQNMINNYMAAQAAAEGK